MIRQLMERGQGLTQTAITVADWEQWRIEVESMLSSALGQNHPGIWPVVTASAKPAQTLRLGFTGGFDYEDHVPPSEHELQQSRVADLRLQLQLLEGHAKSLEARAAATGESTRLARNERPLDRVRTIIERFDHVARQIRRRHDGRSTLKIVDEYDVQDLLHALLLVEFQDVRPEENAPSTAGAHGRMDLLLKQERIVIEVKMTREKLVDRAVGEQLLIDIGRYQSHPDCGTLICFVYDPEAILRNPRGLETDLTKRVNDGFQVVTLIRP